jgi:ribosomal protein S21
VSKRVAFLVTYNIAYLPKGGIFYMAHVVAKNNESIERMIRRFRKTVSQSGVLSITRERRWHIPDSEVRRVAKKQAIRRRKRYDTGGTE